MMRWEKPYNFGCLPPLPAGYVVVWRSSHEHYQAVGPGEWESCITCDPYQARQWCLDHAENEKATNQRKGRICGS